MNEDVLQPSENIPTLGMHNYQVKNTSHLPKLRLALEHVSYFFLFYEVIVISVVLISGNFGQDPWMQHFFKIWKPVLFNGIIIMLCLFYEYK